VQQSQQYGHEVLPLGQAEHAAEQLQILRQMRILDMDRLGHGFLQDNV